MIKFDFAVISTVLEPSTAASTTSARVILVSRTFGTLTATAYHE